MLVEYITQNLSKRKTSTQDTKAIICTEYKLNAKKDSLSFPADTLKVPYLRDSPKKHSHKFVVTVILLLCTSKVGGNPPTRTSKSLTYPKLSVSLR